MEAVRGPLPEERGGEALDVIFIEALRVDTVIGVYDWERRIRQPVVIDLEMGADVAAAAANDDVADTLDYKSVSKRVRQFVEESGFFLVETLTERIAALVLDEFSVPWVRVRLNKVGALRGAAGVGIVIERARGDRTRDDAPRGAPSLNEVGALRGAAGVGIVIERARGDRTRDDLPRGAARPR